MEKYDSTCHRWLGDAAGTIAFHDCFIDKYNSDLLTTSAISQPHACDDKQVQSEPSQSPPLNGEHDRELDTIATTIAKYQENFANFHSKTV